MNYYLLLLVISSSLVFVTSSPRPEVCAPAGCVRGVVESGRLKPYEAFYGIPYAEPPIGELRFKNPVSHSGWSGFWDASYYRNDCLQKNYYMPGTPSSGAEDCLHLNVYRPIDWVSKRRLPVFVWIHGGGYVSFSSSPDQVGPDYLMDNGEVILVTLNYRLGLFGFMCSGDGVVQGNFGLKDQQLAMEWVTRNIEDFGGDPCSVTLGGQSAGAESVNLHMMAEKSQPLFHRAVMSSGNALASFAYPIDFEAQMRTAAKACGIQDWDTATTVELADEFKSVPGQILVEAVDSLIAFVLVPPAPMRFCIEDDWEGAFLSEDPLTVWTEGRFVQKPILTGVTSNEGGSFGILVANGTLNQAYNEDIDHLLPIQLDFDPRWTCEVLKYYFGGIVSINVANEDDFFKLNSDRLANFPLTDLVRKYIQYNDVHESPIFLYEFAYEGNYTFYKYITGFDEHKGVVHLDDLIYLFSMRPLFPLLEPGTLDGEMSDIYVGTMVHFIQTGKVKEWTSFRPCSLSTSKPFCDYQVFKKSPKDPNKILISTSNSIDEDMVKFWKMVDGIIDVKEPEPCPLN